MDQCVHNMLMLPWPGIGPQKPNPALVRTLFGAYAGTHGEWTAVAQATYAGLITETDTRLSDLFFCVAQDDLLHFKKLGRLIIQYGGNPKLLSYTGRQAHWWSAGAVAYNREPQALLRQQIAMKREAVQFYKQLIARMEPAPQAVIQRILQDETHHIELFQRALKA